MNGISSYPGLSVSSVTSTVRDLQQGYFLYDTFQTTSDAASLPSHVGERATWQQISANSGWTGTVRISRRSSGLCELRGNAAGENIYTCMNPVASADHWVAGDFVVRSNNGSFIGVGLRSDYLGTQGYFIRTDGTTWGLCKITAGVTSVLATYAQTLTVGTVYTARIRAQGSSLFLETWDGTNWIQQASAVDTLCTLAGHAFVYLKDTAATATGPHLDKIWGSDGSAVVPWDGRRAIVFVGDSNGTDINALGEQTVSQRLAATLNCPVLNFSASGRTMQGWVGSLLASTTTDAYATLSPYFADITALVMLGTNDFDAGARTSAQVLADAVTGSTSIKTTVGYQRAILYIPPQCGLITSGEETQRDAYETAATAAASSYDVVINLDALLPDQTETTIFQSTAPAGTHYTGLGKQIISDESTRTVFADSRKDASYSAYLTGTVYTLTNSAAAVTGGTTSPTITIATAGKYRICGRFQLGYAGATVVAETATLKLRRTNNTAADLTSASLVYDLPASTVLTHTAGVVSIEVIYTALPGDVITLFANVSAGLGAGTITCEAGGTSIVATPL